jgi:hypothetical protein
MLTLAALIFGSCGGNPNTQPISSGNEVDSWITSEKWGSGSYSFVFAKPHHDWTNDQILIAEAIKSTASEFDHVLRDEQYEIAVCKSQKACDSVVGRVMNEEQIGLMEIDYALNLKSTTAAFRKEMLSEPHTLPHVGDWEEWYGDTSNADAVVAFCDLLCRCNVFPRIHRISSVQVNGSKAHAIVEIKNGAMVDHDTIISGSSFGIPELGNEKCPSVRFDLIKEDGKWLIDHREILK